MKLHKRLERYITALFKLGRTEWQAKQAFRRSGELETRVGNLQGDLQRALSDLTRMRQSLEAGLEDRFALQMEHYKASLATLSRTISDLTARLDRLMMREQVDPRPPEGSAPDLPDAEGFAAFQAQFYHRLENRYRGSREEITKRLKVYLPDVEAALARTGGQPVMDLGCGRGEWVELLKERGAPAYGVDTNAVQIAEGLERGLDLRQGDAVKALSETEDGSLSVLSAHHLIEHLPFETVAWIVREAMRVLAPGGILLFETPNTRNILVGATTFHTDPTHRKPMPEQVMGVLLETAGFYPVELRHLNAHERFDEFVSMPDMNDELAFLLFGPQDLAILGTKPEED